METYNRYIEDSELNMYRNMQTRPYQRANSNVNSNFQTLFWTNYSLLHLYHV